MEEAEPDSDALLDGDGGIELHGIAGTSDGEDEEEETGEKGAGKTDAPRETHAKTHAVGEVGVDAHARSETER